MTKILDCTIRDGGYINNWDFSDKEFLWYLDSAVISGVDYFEIGYRSYKKGGKFVRCNEDEIGSLVKNISSIELVVMLNVSDFERALFSNSETDYIRTVRVACHHHEIENGMQICEYLIDKGYNVFLHLMNVKDLQKTDFENLKNWKRKNEILSLYFADSYGSFLNSDVVYFYEILKNCGYNNISFHAHNNIQMAFSNTLTAINIGAFSVDATLKGMGRGGGNLPIELIMGYLNKENIQKIYQNYFYLMKEDECKKFQNIIGGLMNIHPLKIDEYLCLKNK